MPKKVRTAVFPVGGLGTRFLPATKAMPKEMLPVVDKPVIQYAVEEARAAGIERFIFVTGRGKHAIEDHFDYSFELETLLERRQNANALATVREMMLPPGAVAYVRQMEPRGLGHAVWTAKALVGDEPFAVLLPDDVVQSDSPCLKQLIDIHAELGGNVVAVMDVLREHTRRYGILDVADDDGRLATVKGLVEKPDPAKAPSTLAIIGRYILDPAIMGLLEKQTAGEGDEIQLTDAMALMIGSHPFHGARIAGRRFDCGDKVGYLEANIAFALQRPDLAEHVRASLVPYFGDN